MRLDEPLRVWSNDDKKFPLVCCNRECDCEQYDPVTDEDIFHHKIATCPVCDNEKVRVNSRGVLLSHSAPRSIYKDGRACAGVGKVAVEYRKRPYGGFKYSWQA